MTTTGHQFTMQAQSSPTPQYLAGDKAAIILQALSFLRLDLDERPLMDSPQAVKHYLILMAGLHKDPHVEQFGVLFLDSQHRIIDLEYMFSGTLTQTSVYPREIVRRALHHNAAAVVLTHNHPSGSTQPSRADEALTQTLKSALALVDVRVLDHFITAGDQIRSMAEMGLV